MRKFARILGLFVLLAVLCVSSAYADSSVTLSSSKKNLSGTAGFVISLKNGAAMQNNMIVLAKGKSTQFSVTYSHSDKVITKIAFKWNVVPASGTVSANYGTFSYPSSWNAPSAGIKSVRFSSNGTSAASLKQMIIYYKSVSSGSSSGSGSSSQSSSSTGSLSKYDLNAPVGWGTVGGNITGSTNKNAVVVTSSADLIKAMSGTDAKTIYVKGTLVFSGQMTVQNAANKTVYGLPGSVLSNPVHTGSVDKTGILMIKNSRNIILRNLTFKGAGAYDIDGKDNLTLQNCQYIWVDHCDFQDGVDGNFDSNNGSDKISVTWCRFRYLIKPWAGGSGGSDKHCFSDLWSGSDKNVSKDGGKLNTTFANCWWDEGCIERMPRVRFGKIHIVNCLYSSSVASYCVGAAYRSNIYVENTAFTSSAAQKNPWAVKATSSGYKDYNITLKGCYGASDAQSRSGNEAFFNPYSYYKYTPYAANLVGSVVPAGAGATLSISVGGWPKTSSAKQNVVDMETRTDETTTTAIENINANESSAVVTSVRYYSVDGLELPTMRKGLNIVRTTFADGTVKTSKVFRR